MCAVYFGLGQATDWKKVPLIRSEQCIKN
jgi:hypothetical protein